MIGGRYKAAKVDVSSASKIVSASRLTGLFKTQLANMPRAFESPPLEAAVAVEEPIQQIFSDPISSDPVVEQKGDI